MMSFPTATGREWCPRCRFPLVAYLGHPTCTFGCGWDGERREPTAEDRRRDAQLTRMVAK